MNKIYIGIDNGITGSIGIIEKNYYRFLEIPIKKELSYTKAKQYISRISFKDINNILEDYALDNCIALIERPMVNPGRYKATLSAIRCLEATLIAIELNSISYQWEDSKSWQRELLPSGLKGSSELKKASMDIGCRLFPNCKEEIQKHKDADGLLIAEYGRRNEL